MRKTGSRGSIKSLQSHAWQQSVYAFTTAKTKGKAWSYSKGESELVPLFDRGYVEANSNEGNRLRKCFERMKSFPPANVLGAPNSNIASQPHAVRTRAAAPAPNPGQISHATTPAQSRNPIFPRAETTTDSRTQTIIPSSGTDGFTQVVATRDPREGKPGLVYKVGGRWVEMGSLHQGQRNGKKTLESREKSLWVYVDDVQ